MTVEQALMTRLSADSVLQSLLGGAGRIVHALEKFEPKEGMVSYSNVSSVPGDVDGLGARTETELYQFNIFADNYEAVKERLFRLLQQYQFPTPSDAGIKSCTMEWVGPDEFDEPLQVGVKRIRFRIEICRSAQEPV
jgi:hypothetical protein